MKIWVDADALPSSVRDIIAVAAHKRSIEAIFVANSPLTLPTSPHILFTQVDMSPDAADRLIAEKAEVGDLVVTQDIPLAHNVVQKGVAAISPRGVMFTEENIGERLAMRNLLQDVRDSGEITGGPKQFGEREKRAFAATFDRELSKLANKL